MLIKVILTLLCIGIMTQVSAFDAATLEFIKESGPLILFPLAPFILTGILVIAIKILIYGIKLIYDLFQTEEE